MPVTIRRSASIRTAAWERRTHGRGTCSSPATWTTWSLYDRYVTALLAFFQCRAAIRRRPPPDGRDVPAAMVSRPALQAARAKRRRWLFAIAHHKLTDFRRRGSAETRMRARLGMEPVQVGAEDAEMIRWLGDDVATAMVEELPAEQRDAIRAHVLEDRDYADIARSERLSEATVRKRVSRGLRVLRERTGGSR